MDMTRGGDDDDNTMQHLLSVAQCVINMNLVLMRSLRRRRLQRQRLHHLHSAMRILFPDDHRHLRRGKRAIFRHHEAFFCIQRDYLGIPGDLTTPIFQDRTFQMMFRVSRSRVQRMFEDVMRMNHPFYANSTNAIGQKGASLEAKVLLPLKTFAYGVAPHTFTDYFQMSEGLAARCCDEFAAIIKCIYENEYLRTPDATDLRSILQLHNQRHGVNGMFGSLDCMHTEWKNCPKAWQGSFQTKKESGRGPTVVLEALCDYNMWFWHASFGYAGSLNDLNILNLSPFLESLIDGSFSKLEKDCRRLPYEVKGEMFDKLFVLVDGIYPPYSRFVKGIQMPLTNEEQRYTAWQEAKRKDIERAFGVLQSQFQVMSRPYMGFSLQKFSTIVSTCLIMHNMCVSDRVMDGNVHARYNPGNALRFEQDIDFTIEYENGEDAVNGAAIGLDNTDNRDVVNNMLSRQNHWRDINDREEHARLLSALIKLHGVRRQRATMDVND